MIEEIKVLLGETADNFTDEQIGLCAKQSLLEVESYCNRKVDVELEMVAVRLAVIKLNRLNSEGLSQQSYSGIAETYVDGYPADILAILNRKRKIKIL